MFETKSILVIIQSDNVFNKKIILIESNYDIWSQLIEMYITEREKLFYIHCKVKMSTKDENDYEKWYANDQKVKRWLLMSVSP